MADARETRWSLARDALDVVLLGALYGWIHVPTVFHGMPWGDPGWYFHFGRRFLHGAVPYRDFVFQVGPIPIFVDAAFQKILGEGYRASLYAGLSVKFVRVALTMLIARRLSGSRWLAWMIAAFLTFERVWYSFANHWSVGYTQISVLATTYFFVLAQGNARRRVGYVALAGASIGLMFGARQSNAAVATVLLFAATGALVLRGTGWLTRRHLLALASGYAAGLAILAAVLASMGALGSAVQQMFLDAPQKKNVGGLEALADMISGGWATHWKYDTTLTLFTSFIKFQAAPLVVVLLVLGWLARPRSGSPALALMVIPIAYLVGGTTTSFCVLDVYHDLPRTLATLGLVWLAFAPARAARAFGVSAEILAVLLAVPLAMEWAMELSFPGRGWSEVASLMTAMLILAAASRRTDPKAKAVVLGLIAISQIVIWRSWISDGINPFTKYDYWEGTVAENQVALDVPVLRGVYVNESRARFIGWLTRHVKPGDSCFIYGSMPALYDVVDCTNPSKLDTTAADFFTGADGDQVIDALRRSPPKWIIAQEAHWMNPDLEIPYTGDDGIYAGLNPRASRSLHQGLRSLLPRYELLEPSRSIFTPAEIEQASKAHDHLERVRLYRLRE